MKKKENSLIEFQLKRYLYSINNISIDRLYDAVLRRRDNVRYALSWHMNFGFSKQNKKKLANFKGIHNNQRCFILANGPSLKKVDFDLLKDEITIGMNRIYMMEKINGFLPTYLVSIDEKCQLKQFYEEYNNLKIPCFFTWNQKKLFDKKENQLFIKVKFSTGFSKDIVKKQTYNGASVTYTCIQLAYYMGFKEVYLIGKDHKYNCDIKSGNTCVSNGNENNHFIDGYYKKGQVWDAPSYEIEEMAYKIARSVFEEEKRIIKDATDGGNLVIFEKVEFNTLFKNKY
jgi:hypothetical protein